MNDVVTLTPQEQAARKRRNMIIALSVVGFVVLVFAITIAQMAAHSGGHAS
ncbi:MAG: hypothetical protein QM759_17695 [Terricaulis sp.]